MSDSTPGAGGQHESTDGTEPSPAGGTDQRPASAPRRLLQAAGAVAGLSALAGCSSTEDANPTPTPANGDGSGAGSTPTPSTSPSPAPSPTPSPTATPDRTCDRLRADIDAVEADIEAVRNDLEAARTEMARLEGIRDQLPGGWDDATVATARQVGVAIRESILVLQFDSGGGTGWYIDEHHVITNAHVASNTGEPVGWTVDGTKVHPTRVRMDDNWAPDVAVMRTEAPGTPLPLGSTESLEPADPLVMVGHPFDAGNWRIGLGHYLWTKADETAPTPADDTPILYSSLPGRAGVSGAPVVDFSGKVVGLTFGGTSRGEGRILSEAPDPSDTTVVDWPIAPKAWGKHVAVETVKERFAEWV